MFKHFLVMAIFILSISTLAIFEQNVEAGDTKNQKSIESYVVPDVVLTNQNGIRVSLKSLLYTGRPVMLDFIYSACTTTCPVLSADYANLQNKIAPDTQKVQLVSISVDPVNDTPQVMKGYLKRYHAKPGWVFLTGSTEDVEKVMKSFRIKDMSYNYFTLIRTTQDGNWTKINGHLNVKAVIDEYLK